MRWRGSVFQLDIDLTLECKFKLRIRVSSFEFGLIACCVYLHVVHRRNIWSVETIPLIITKYSISLSFSVFLSLKSTYTLEVFLNFSGCSSVYVCLLNHVHMLGLTYFELLYTPNKQCSGKEIARGPAIALL